MQFVTVLFTGHEGVLKTVGEFPPYATALIGIDQFDDTAVCMSKAIAKFLLADVNFYPLHKSLSSAIT